MSLHGMGPSLGGFLHYNRQRDIIRRAGAALTKAYPQLLLRDVRECAIDHVPAVAVQPQV
jgi:hypothetical protein